MNDAKIMLVEDQLIPAHDLRRQLIDMGYNVVSIFTEAERALDFLEKNKETERFPQVIIMDITLAGKMDGIEASRIIHEKYNCEMIFLTGLLDMKAINEILSFIPAFFLVKPFDIYYTHICIQMALRQLDLKNEIRQLRSEIESLRSRQ